MLSNEIIKKIESYSNKALFYYDIPGLAIGIGQKDVLLYNGSFGYRNIENKENLKENDIFHMASVTKLFTGTAIMQLHEKEQLSIDDFVCDYLPHFKMTDNRYKKITIRQLLSHTSGMPDCEDYQWEKPDLSDTAIETYVKSFDTLNLLWEPGTQFLYSNNGYEMLGNVIQIVSGLSIEDYVKIHIFEPLGMTSTTLFTPEREMGEVATPHIKDSEKRVVVSSIFPYNRRHCASSTLTSCVTDIGKWGFANLNRGFLGENRILKTETYDIMWKIQKEINEREAICLSWFTRKQEGYRIYGHEGTDIGFRSSFGIVPELGLYVSVHTNIQSAPTKKIHRNIVNLVLGYEIEG